MTAEPISRQVVDGDAVLADSQCTCIFQLSCEWYFINFVGKFGIHSGMLFELPLKKKNIKQSKHIITKVFFYFYQNITPMHLVLQSMYVVLVLAKKVVKDCCLPPPPMDTSWAGMGPGYYQQTFKNHGYLLPAKFWWNSLCNFGEVAEFVI